MMTGTPTAIAISIRASFFSEKRKMSANCRELHREMSLEILC